MTPADVVAEFLALSVVESTNGPGVEIFVELGRTTAMLRDTGRGMKITPDPGDTVSHAERALTSIFPIHPDDPEIERVLVDLVWGERGSLGPSPANAACPRLEFRSVRGGETWSQRFRHGVPEGPPFRLGDATASGTTVELVTDSVIDHGAVAELVDELTTRIPRLRVHLSATEGPGPAHRSDR